MSLKSLARSILGDDQYVSLANSYRGLKITAHPKMVTSRRRLRSYKDKYRGERCFIIGNGPSLNKTDLTLLAAEYTFGLNRIYLIFKELGFYTTFFVSVNKLVIAQSNHDIEKLLIPTFLSWNSHNLIQFRSNMMFINSLSDPGFYPDVTKGLWEGATVTFVAMQLAYFMGFNQVILIGVDHSFATKGKPHQEVISQGEDPNHFHPEYFGRGFRWNLPDLDTSELAYTIAKNHFSREDREIVDATIGGKLQIFPKVDYYSLFD